MSRTGSQERTLLGILAKLRPHWRSDFALPARIDSILSGDRRLGSRDRRLYRELAYTALRYLPWVEPLLGTAPSDAARRIAWLAADAPAVSPFRAEMVSDMPECPPDADSKALILGEDAGPLTPPWFALECPAASAAPLRNALLSRAPLWLRLQTGDPAPVLAEFEALGLPYRASGLLEGALELPAGCDIGKTDAYLSGKVEIQDIGSQLVLSTAGIDPGGRWLDACAGAGGKALQLASLLGPAGRVAARDVRRPALEELSRRAARAGLGSRISITGEPAPPGGYDGVLVDAPCSGSGTWRRAPHLRWATTAASVHAAARLQLRLLMENAPLVRTGGLLVYATCSLCLSENEDVAGAFLGAARKFESARAACTLLPQAHNGDGFFVASFRRAS